MKLALSTCCLSQRHQDGYEMLKEIADLGFDYAELSHGIRISLVPGILKAVDEGFIRISSVHNFCPLPAGVMSAAPNLYQPTATHAGERDLWHRHTLKTLDFARRVGAELMVIHSGSASFFLRSPADKLDAFREGRDAQEIRTDPRYGKVLTKCLEAMRRRQAKHIAFLLEGYRKLTAPARERGVRIAVENREGFDELPLDTEMYGLLQQLGEADVFGYWHDTGHAQIKEMVGTIRHEQLLAENNARQWGFHLHDVTLDERDHQPLGTGIIDWPMVRRFMKPEHTLVLELSPRVNRTQIGNSREFLLKLLQQPTAQALA